MNPTRRWFIALIGLAIPLAGANSEASAARHHARPRVAQSRIAGATTATYHATARPHAPRHLRAGHLHDGRFAQTVHRAPPDGG